MDTKDEQYHLRCLSLAYRGLGLVAPNPLVGAVLIANQKIIGEGFHYVFGGNHAEVNAINQVKKPQFLKTSTLLVNLEPCSHHGKTPPCVNLIIEKEIKRVEIGEIDPYPKVAGKGIKKLQRADIEVNLSMKSPLSRFINRRFFTFHEKKRPYIILKWAQSYDGYLDKLRSSTQPVQWITDIYSRILVHKWRTEEQAIMVGTNTVVMDNPQLTVRYFYGKNPIRLVLDRNLRIPHHMKIFDQQSLTYIFTQKTVISQGKTHYVTIPFKDALTEIMDFCYQNQIQSVIVEGGSQLLESFIERNLWDESRVFTGEKIFENGIKAPQINRNPKFVENINKVILEYYFNDEWEPIANIDYL